MSINTSAASRRDEATREAIAAQPDDELSYRPQIDHTLVLAGRYLTPSNLRAALRHRRDLVRWSVRRAL